MNEGRKWRLMKEIIVFKSDMQMKITHLLTHDGGGAARATFRISEALNQNGLKSEVVDCKLLCSKSEYWWLFILGNIWKVIEKKRMGKNKKNLFTYDVFGISQKTIAKLDESDIIHLHWVADGMLSLTNFDALLKLGKPIIWTLHDMHPFTGGCHYDDECGKYTSSCGKCPELNSNFYKDFTTWNQKKKGKILSKANIHIVGCSQWITNCAKNSTVMRTLDCRVIPNCIDVTKYRPIDRMIALSMFNLEQYGGKKIILFGAMSSTTDERKGFFYLKHSLEKLDKSQYICLVFGGKTEGIGELQVVSIGYVHDDTTLSLLYNCADVFVAPSIQENLANTVMESLSCGTPVVAFNIGGMTDMIEHKANGYLAIKQDIDDLANGIRYCCENQNLRTNARNSILNKYTFRRVAKIYRKLYEEVLYKKEMRFDE